MIKMFGKIGPIMIALMGCQSIEHIGVTPAFSPMVQSREHRAMEQAQTAAVRVRPAKSASLWRASRGSLLGDRRAEAVGDILTVMIEINDQAEMSNSSSRRRDASEDLSIPNLFGIPQRRASRLPEGASFDNAIGIGSTSKASGDGTIKRKEKLTLKIAATVMKVMPNGVLSIHGTQEVRVNHELRELIVSGFVRPQDISRSNSITYDKIASARVSYGGRGDVSDVQQPRYGYQVLDVISPF